MPLDPNEIEQIARRVLSAVGDEEIWMSRFRHLAEPPLLPHRSTQASEGLAPDALARMIDHTLLKPEATEAQIRRLCQEAKTQHFATVCINPFWASLCANLLDKSDVGVCAVVGFPLGASLPAAKAYEAKQLCQQGAREIDMVLNIGALKSQDFHTVMNDVAAVVSTCRPHQALVKVIIETALLSDSEKVEACALAKAADAHYVKTSTGFGPGGATVEDVALMRHVVGDDIGVKAAGGIRSYQDALKMIAAGASRLGASAGINIVQEAREESH